MGPLLVVVSVALSILVACLLAGNSPRPAVAQASSCGNAIVESGEDCDPPDSLTCPGGSPGSGLLLPCSPFCLCPPVPTTTTSTVAPATSTTTLPPTDIGNHFQCYEIRPPGAFSRTGVHLVDQFGDTTVDLRRAFALCAPADKNDEDPTAPADAGHLTAYGIRPRARFTRVPGQRVVNQFGTLVVDVVKPARLLVPTAKSLAGPPSSPVPGLLDHFQCYKVKRAKGAARFTRIPGLQVDTQFETGARVDLVKPLRLCAPVDKNGETPGAATHAEHVLCYRTRSAVGVPPRGVSLANQFGAQSYQLGKRLDLCVPSFKNPPPTTTSTTTTTSTSTSTTSTTIFTCGQSPFPICGGSCPEFFTCEPLNIPDAMGCFCLAPSCGTFPTCGGPCPPGLVCVGFSLPGFEICTCALPP